MECEYWDETTGVWTTFTDPPLKYCSMSDGVVFELESTDGTVSTYRPEYAVDMRIVYTSTSSNLDADEGSVATDYFTLNI